jgi:rubrerythrin
MESEIVTCAVCDTDWENSDDNDECPECGSEYVWDMEAAFEEAGYR